MIQPIHGYVLCGGQSKRMGTNKALYPFRKQAMADHIGSLLTEAGCTQVFHVCKHPLPQLHQFSQIVDHLALQHPLSGVAKALAHSVYEFAVIIPCDLPFVRIESLRQLIRSSYPRVADRQPLLGVFPKLWETRAVEFAKLSKSVRQFSAPCDLFYLEDHERKNINYINDFGDRCDYD